MFGKGKDKDKEPDSKDIWKDLNNAELGWCCKFLQEFIKYEKKSYLNFFFTSKGHVGEYAGMKMNYCPRCGRKLEL